MPRRLGRLRRLADRVLAMGPAVVALKLGDQGLYIRTSGDGAALERLCGRLALDRAAWRDREVLAPCFRAARVAGTTGSGDCTIAGLLAALLRGEDPVAVATSANAVGACSVEAPDATSGVPRWSDVARASRPVGRACPSPRPSPPLPRGSTTPRAPSSTPSVQETP